MFYSGLTLLEITDFGVFALKYDYSSCWSAPSLTLNIRFSYVVQELTIKYLSKTQNISRLREVNGFETYYFSVIIMQDM